MVDLKVFPYVTPQQKKIFKCVDSKIVSFYYIDSKFCVYRLELMTFSGVQ